MVSTGDTYSEPLYILYIMHVLILALRMCVDAFRVNLYSLSLGLPNTAMHGVLSLSLSQTY